MRAPGCILLALLVFDSHAHASAREPLAVSVRLASGELIADFSLPTPQRHFDFASRPGDPRARSWRMLTPNLMLDKDRVLATTRVPFDKFSVRIGVDAIDVDRVYPVLQKVGSRGLLLHTTHFAGEAAVYAAPSISITLPDGYVALAGGMGEPLQAATSRTLPVDRYVFVGPRDYVQITARAAIVRAPDTPGWLLDTVQENFHAALSAYEQQLNARLPQSATLIVGYSPDALASSWRGDTSPGYTLALRFLGTAWCEPSDNARADLRRFVFHESFHFWNGELLRSSVGTAQPWLHEGSAEYASILLDALLSHTDTGLRERVAANLNACRAVLGTLPLSDPAAASGKAPYACGMTLFWIADTSSKRAHPQPGFFAAWRAWLARARRDRQWTYGVGDFMSLVENPAARDASERILNGHGDERWPALASDLRTLGVVIAMDTRDDSLRAQLFDHVLSINCPQSTRRGTWLRTEVIELDSEPSCKTLPDGTRITQIEGHDVLADARAAFEAVARRCARRERVALRTPAETISVACDRPLAEPAQEFRIVTLDRAQ